MNVQIARYIAHLGQVNRIMAVAHFSRSQPILKLPDLVLGTDIKRGSSGI